MTVEESSEEKEDNYSDTEEPVSRSSFVRREDSYVDRKPILSTYTSKRGGSFDYEEPMPYSNVTLRKDRYRVTEPMSHSFFTRSDLSSLDGETTNSRRITRREGSCVDGDSVPYSHFTKNVSHRLQ